MLSFLIGIFVSVLSGMGVGGGGLLVLWLSLVSRWEITAARGVNLLFFCVSAVSALPYHAKHRKPDRYALGLLLLGALPGVFLGQRLSGILPPDILRRVFGYFLLTAGGYGGIRAFFPKNTKQ